MPTDVSGLNNDFKLLCVLEYFIVNFVTVTQTLPVTKGLYDYRGSHLRCVYLEVSRLPLKISIAKGNEDNKHYT